MKMLKNEILEVAMVGVAQLGKAQAWKACGGNTSRVQIPAPTFVLW